MCKGDGYLCGKSLDQQKNFELIKSLARFPATG